VKSRKEVLGTNNLDDSDTFGKEDSKGAKDKNTDSNKVTNCVTPEPCSNRFKRKCILPLRYRTN